MLTTNYQLPVTPRISLIAALTEERVIGKGNRIPWHIKDDFLHFKNYTLNHTVVMGRTTFESITSHYQKGKQPLPGRRIVIVSRDKSYSVPFPDCFIAHSVDEALSLAVEKERLATVTYGVTKAEVFVSGGASIFEQTIGRANRLHLTIIHKQFEGDTYFPDYSMFTKAVGEEKKKTEEGLEYTFLDLEK